MRQCWQTINPQNTIFGIQEQRSGIQPHIHTHGCICVFAASCCINMHGHTMKYASWLHALLAMFTALVAALAIGSHCHCHATSALLACHSKHHLATNERIAAVMNYIACDCNCICHSCSCHNGNNNKQRYRFTLKHTCMFKENYNKRGSYSSASTALCMMGIAPEFRERWWL